MQTPPAQSETDRLRARAVWLYHVQGQTQNDIAQALGISRVVVRLFADTRRRNEVRATVSAPLAELEARHGIARVILAPFQDPEGDPVRAIAAAGAFISAS